MLLLKSFLFLTINNNFLNFLGSFTALASPQFRSVVAALLLETLQGECAAGDGYSDSDPGHIMCWGLQLLCYLGYRKCQQMLK